jgi:hypothetical protein
VNRDLSEKYKLVNALKRDHDFLHKRLDEKLKPNREVADEQKWRLIHAKIIAELKETLRFKQQQLCQEKSELEEKTNELNTRKNSLAEALAVLEKNKTKQLKLHSDQICTLNSRLAAVQADLLKYQSVAIKQLCKIFPLAMYVNVRMGKKETKDLAGNITMTPFVMFVCLEVLIQILLHHKNLQYQWGIWCSF